MWYVIDTANASHSTTRTTTAQDFAEGMNAIWGKQGAIRFSALSTHQIRLPNVDPNGQNAGSPGSGIELGDEMEAIRNRGYVPSGQDPDADADIINIYCVYKIATTQSGTIVNGRASSLSGMDKATPDSHFLLISDLASSVGYTAAHEFGHLVGLKHTKVNAAYKSIFMPLGLDDGDLSSYVPYTPYAGPSSRRNQNLMATYANVGGAKLRWEQIDAVNTVIGRK